MKPFLYLLFCLLCGLDYSFKSKLGEKDSFLICPKRKEMQKISLTIIPRARVGYEMVDSQRITISYPTSASGIIVLLKTPKRIEIVELPSCFR